MELKNCSENNTIVINFMLLGFLTPPSIKPLLFFTFLVMYLFSVAGNLMIVVAISTHKSLQSPMYFFLGNLSSLEIWYIIALAPTALGSLLPEGSIISFLSCIAQCFFVGVMLSTECCMLTAMAYDRYVAICYPLHYTTIMGKKLCIQLAITSWVTGFTMASLVIFPLGQLQFPYLSVVDHYFCDLAPLLREACSDTFLTEIDIIVVALFTFFVPFPIIIVSYTAIIMTILRIPSAVDRKKAFSTCSSHLVVVIAYFGSLITTYCMPKTSHSLSLNKLCSLLYTMATPLLNPIIYTLRNKAIKEVLGRFLIKRFLLPVI